MKRKLIAVDLCALVLSIGIAAFGQQKPRARDLYTDYNKTAHHPHSQAQRKGRPGSKVKMELMRDGQLNFVSSKHAILNGDRIAFRLAVNYEGYMTVTNIGTSGKINLLFAGRVSPTSDMRIPQKGWIRVAGQSGNEVVNFIMSSGPLPELQQAGVQVSDDGATAGNLASSDEAQQILELINSRALIQGRDLLVEDDENNTFAICPTTKALLEPRGFSIRLNHK